MDDGRVMDVHKFVTFDKDKNKTTVDLKDIKVSDKEPVEKVGFFKSLWKIPKANYHYTINALEKKYEKPASEPTKEEKPKKKTKTKKVRVKKKVRKKK